MRIFPKEFLEKSKELYLKTVTIKSQIIYLVFLLSICAVLCSFPFIKVDTFTQARGIIKTKTEQINIFASTTAPIENLNITENSNVQQGDTLVTFFNDHNIAKMKAIKFNLENYNQYVQDLRTILYKNTTNRIKLINLQSDLISSEFIVFQEKVKEALFNINIREKEYNRYKELLKSDFVSEAEHETVKHKFDSAQSRYEQLLNSSLSGWQARLRQYEFDIEALKAELSNLEQINDSYFIVAPTTGTIQEFQGLQSGSFIIQNQLIAKISPKSELIAELLITPQYIGLIVDEHPVNFQIDAFNYREWGKIEGIVTEISDDAIIISNTPYFKLRCNLKQKHLTLKNGYRGNLKKGMTLTANFLLRKRSLYNLLFDKIDDWVNPKSNIIDEEVN